MSAMDNYNIRTEIDQNDTSSLLMAHNRSTTPVM